MTTRKLAAPAAARQALIAKTARTEKADIGVFILRASPYHLGHHWVVEHGLENCKHLVLVIGSAFAARRWDILPWTHDERIEMISNCLTPEQLARVTFLPMIDHANMTTWATALGGRVEEIAAGRGLADPVIALVGHKKDKPTGYYLSQFPDWEPIDVPNHHGLNATPIRDYYIGEDRAKIATYLDSDEPFDNPLTATCARAGLPLGTINFLKRFLDTAEYAELLAEKLFMKRYLAPYEKLRWPPIFNTVDNVVIQGDKVLMVLRRNRPCKGMWALPGGHVFEAADLYESALGELTEETCIDVPEAVLRGSLIGTKSYSDPMRSTRKRTITQAFFFHLKPSTRGETDVEKMRAALALPKVTPRSDARKAKWLPISQVLSPEFRCQIMEDHWKIIQDAVAAIHKEAA